MGSMAGDGVFIRGEVPMGSVVSLYSGLVYRNSDEFLKSYVAENGSAYLMARYDGMIVDGIYGAGDREESRDIEQFALGEIVNHPNKGELPNVYTAQFRYPEHLERGLALYIPTRYCHDKPQTWLPSLVNTNTMPGIAMVAARDIGDGEELLLNYRLNPAGELPEWYHQVDKEEDARRWS